MSKPILIFCKRVVILVVALLSHPQVWALSTGITEHSGNPAVNGGGTCVLCHSGGIVPNLELTGPVVVEAGSVNSFNLQISGGQNNLAGLNVSVSSGSLTATMAGVDLRDRELVHSQPFNAASGGVGWTFSYTAPAVPGNVTLYATALSANGDGQMTGDNAASVTLVVEVTATQKKLAPQAAVGGPYSALPGANIQFDAGQSVDGDGTIVRYLWDFGDGAELVQGVQPLHAYAAEGTYTVTVAATDNDGLTGAAATSVTVSNSPDNAQGQALYNSNCFACHGANGAGGSAKAIAGVSVQQIEAALQSIAAMQNIALSPDEIALIAQFLATGGGEPPTRPTDGPGLYGMFCSACHGAGGRGGAVFGVTGAALQMIDQAITNVTDMQSIALDAEELQKVAAYLGAGGDGAMPTEGNGLYPIFCAICHGTGGQGGKFKRVTGAAPAQITAALNDVDWMRNLVVTTTQIQKISAYLDAGGEPPLPTGGPGLYEVFCMVCHGAGGRGGKFTSVTGAPAAMISDALTGVPWMKSLVLTPSQTQLIAGYLVAGGSGATPVTGAEVYAVFCAVCHGRDGRGGKYKVVTGASSSFVNGALSRVGLMRSLTLNIPQTQAVAGYLAAGGGGVKPTDGAGLYHVYCETCHGVNGRGGPEEAVAGASVSEVNSALNGASEMRHLRAYLTTSGAASDTALIGQFLTRQ